MHSGVSSRGGTGDEREKWTRRAGSFPGQPGAERGCKQGLPAGMVVAGSDPVTFAAAFVIGEGIFTALANDAVPQNSSKGWQPSFRPSLFFQSPESSR